VIDVEAQRDLAQRLAFCHVLQSSLYRSICILVVARGT
jgi:hypothetical protein